MDKRSFLKTFSLASISAPLWASPLDSFLKEHAQTPSGILAGNEEFWATIRSGYKLKPDYINLENGYYNFIPQETLEHFINHVRMVNYEASYYMRTVQWDNKKRMAAKLANLLGCAEDELIITRNTTESLDMVIGGFPWKEGDEAVMAEQDYGAMLDMFKQVERRYGVKNVRVSVPNHPKSDDEIVSLYENAITPQTKLLMVCHMVNITGQILPVRKICDMAHKKGVQVMVDGAHCVGHFEFSLADLNCDYYGSSLHKWLSVPLGAGILYVAKKNIPNIWPLLAEAEREPDDISRLNHIGTHPVHTDLAIENALDYYQKIGGKRKEDRLRFLQNYWVTQVRYVKNVVVNTPEDPSRSCAIANVGIAGIKPSILAERLFNEYKIYTVAIDYANVQGCRITPNIFTTTQELDVLVKALKELSGN